MTFIARIIRFLFWLLVVSWSVRLLRHVVRWILGNAAGTVRQTTEGSPAVHTPGGSRRLVRDPVCGMHVDETLSIPLREDGELLHFCSPACRDAYVSNTRKFAANE